MTTTSLFKRLQSYRPRPERDSKEDFFTEALCYVLEKNPKVLKKYIEFLLKKEFPEVDQDNITIETQCQFGGRPDVRIKFKDDNYLIICEHKLDAKVDIEQLKNYDSTLKGQRKCSKPVIKGGWLVLITKNSYSQTSIDEEREQEPELPKYLIKFTWRQIYQFMLNCKEDNLVDGAYRELFNDFLKYMKELKMSPPEKFTAMELAELCHIPNLLRSIDECFGGEAWKAFECLPNLRRQAYQAEVQLPKHGRWTYNRTLAQADDMGELKVYMGLYLDTGSFKDGFGLDENDGEFPELVIWLESPPKKLRKEYVSYCEKLSKEPYFWKKVTIINLWAMVYVHKPITDFIKDGERQIEKIQNWFAKHLRELKKFLEENPIEE